MGACSKCGAVLAEVPSDAISSGAAVATLTCPQCAAGKPTADTTAKPETPSAAPTKDAPPSQRVTVVAYDILIFCAALAHLISPRAWPLLFVSAAMIVAAYIDGWKLKVPNWLTFRIILAGWALGAFYDLTAPPDAISPQTLESGSRFLASVAVSFIGFAIFLPIFAIGGVGAGDVKMQMGFGAWVGAFCGLYQGFHLLFWGYLVGIIVGGVLGVAIMLVRREFGTYTKHTREILLDLATSGGNIGKVADKAAQRKPNMTLLPYGIPLCIGYLAYMLLYFFI